MIFMDVTGEQQVSCQPLNTFAKLFQVHYVIGTDTSILRVDPAMTMAQVWEEFSEPQKHEICGAMSNFKKHRNIHPGLLALLTVQEVIDSLCFPRPLNFSDIVKTALRDRTDALVANLKRSNALLARISKHGK